MPVSLLAANKPAPAQQIVLEGPQNATPVQSGQLIEQPPSEEPRLVRVGRPGCADVEGRETVAVGSVHIDLLSQSANGPIGLSLL